MEIIQKCGCLPADPGSTRGFPSDDQGLFSEKWRSNGHHPAAGDTLVRNGVVQRLNATWQDELCQCA